MASDGIRVVLAKGALRGTISGANETVVTYATHLRRHGHDVSVLLIYPPRRTNPYLRRLLRAGVPVAAAAPVDIERAILAAAPMRRLGAVARPAGDTVRSLLQEVPDRYAVGCQRHLRRSGADLVHVVGQDTGAGTLIAAAHAVGLPTLFQELGGGVRPSAFPSVTAALRRCSEVAALSPQIAARVGSALAVGGHVSASETSRRRARTSRHPNGPGGGVGADLALHLPGGFAAV